MPGSFELTVQKALRSRTTIDRHLEDWVFKLSPNSKPEEYIGFFEFAFNTGRWQFLFEKLPIFLVNKWPIHWGVVLEICAQSKLKIPKEVFASITKGARKQHLVNLLILSHSYDSTYPEFEDFRKVLLNKAKDSLQNRRQTLIEKLGFLKTQRMIDEEGKLLKFLMKAYPDDPQILKASNEFEDRWARHVLSSRSELTNSESFESSSNKLTAEELAWIESLLDELKGFVQINRHWGYLFAVSLNFMELYKEALELLELSEDSAAKDWLKLELLISSRRFLEAVDLSQTIESKYAEDPDTTFGALYGRARALHGLGQKTSAIDLLKDILEIRPHYRSAHSLLTSWVGDRG
ncbi:MAG: tetratricopeptide repeat protein [Bdellovibrionales bacterium]|nr:tetratricopeptide repeat protein [Bdellovibrionales bacterium]